MMLKTKILILAMIVLTQSVCAQNTKPSQSVSDQNTKSYFGWDLSYESVLEKNNVGRDQWIWKWLKFTYKKDYDPDYETHAKKWISEWKGEPIISSILIDFPAFHAGEHTTMWFFRTKNNAYYWEFIDDNLAILKKKELKLEVYDKIVEQMSAWEQYKPAKPEDIPDQVLPGYIGFLSVYDKNKSRQMLLTFQDFSGCETKECDKKQLGRFFTAIEPVLSE